MKILVVGDRGREYALALSFKTITEVERIYLAPGNSTMVGLGILLPISSENAVALLDFAIANEIDRTIVGSELVCAQGIADLFLRDGKKSLR